MPEPIIDLNSRVVQMPSCVSADLGGETAILDPESGLYFSANKVGAVIWNAIHQPVLLSEVLVMLLEEFDVDAARCEQDLLRLIRVMLERKLVNVSS